MIGVKIEGLIAVAACLLPQALAQDEEELCYGAGSIVGAVIGTLLITLGCLAGTFFWKNIYKDREGELMKIYCVI